MKLFMIRHGQSEANLKNLYAGQTDAKLTPLGREQALTAAPKLAGIPFDKVYSSDLSRAHDTQKLALPGYEAITLESLREYNVGIVTGMDIEEARVKYGPFPTADYSTCGGESFPMVRQRVASFLKLLEEDPCEYVAAFSHNGVMKAMLSICVGDYYLPGVENGNCNVAVFEYKDESWRLLCWNYGAKY